MDVREVIATLPNPRSAFAIFLLNERGLVLNRHEKPDCFGDRLVDFRRDDLCVRFVRDRDDWDVMVADGRQEDWYDMMLVGERILGRDSAKPMAIEAQVTLLRENWSAVAQAFGPTALRETKAALKEIGMQRARRLLSRPA